MTPEDFEKEWFDASTTVQAHTSGSTGAPKDIKLLKADMRASAHATNVFFGLTAESTFVCPLAVDYIAGKMMMVRAFEAGTRALMLPPSSAPQWDGRASLLAVVPSQVEAVLTCAERIENLLVGGAPLTPRQRQAILCSGVKAYESYGMTETCSHVALRRVGERCFRAMPGVDLGQDSRGCLTLSLPHYSIRRIVTNDIVSLAGPNEFEWLGRADNVINSGGIKIHPEVLESVISATIPDLTDFYIAGRVSERWGEEPVIVVVGENETDAVSIDHIRLKLLQAGIDRRCLPKDIIKVSELPRTANGKLRRLRYS